MVKAFKRSDRVASELKRQLSIILQKEVNTRDLGMVVVTDLQISPDLIYAKAFVSFLTTAQANELTPQEKIASLTKQVPYIRSLIAKAVKLRVVPEIKFIYDDSADKYDQINQVLNSIKK
ncbi:ribosome-binding factor A [Psittacicella melopsittaci]|uniref:Ribosome-binding factor A n=1 Tax=Psittacicella melopsittaci TaxID=2028576 RepID=A0A3A1Y6S4_9GAMM|nr:30S ribosome-binding factor RbfA [Psittacicella melopsittaci]RIY33006.1 ribosome-binding factor A [Psittacicella melopsittaci]